MAHSYITNEVKQKIIKFANEILHLKVTEKNNILFHNSVYITDTIYDDGHPEKFLLIFNIKRDYYGQKVASIKYFQMPKSKQHKKLGAKIYLCLEEQFYFLKCQLVKVEATVNFLDNSKSTVGFWQYLHFNKTKYCFDDCDICPMEKHLKQKHPIL